MSITANKGEFVMLTEPVRQVAAHPRSHAVLFSPSSSRSRFQIKDAGQRYEVKLVDGDTIYLQTADGNVVTVKTDGKTTVSTAKKGKVSDVKAGESVTAQGATGADGTVTATSVTARPH